MNASLNVAHAVNAGAVSPQGEQAPVITGVLTIESMPARLRQQVEQLMCIHLRSESTWENLGDDPLLAQWCTRWFKDWPGMDLASLAAGKGAIPAGIGCRQTLTATAHEFACLAHDLDALALENNFSAQLTWG